MIHFHGTVGLRHYKYTINSTYIIIYLPSNDIIVLVWVEIVSYLKSETCNNERFDFWFSYNIFLLFAIAYQKFNILFLVHT